MAKTLSGTYLSLKVFIPHGDSLQEQIKTLQDLQAAQESGMYGALMGKAKLLEARTDQRRMRFDDQQPAQDDQPAVDYPDSLHDEQPRRKRG